MMTKKAELRASSLIAKFWLGHLTENEKIELEKWVQQSLENQKTFSQATDINQLLGKADELLAVIHKRKKLSKPAKQQQEGHLAK